ncbi:hypothetical protein MNB_SV-6-1239 [hydrothermal vent metagenome]|uniref:Uncharacterized protein n=1 Tax=hydrothermal vent metagenome TaxID=652676 RepID=A0A1W1B9W1_9ZZZZ
MLTFTKSTKLTYYIWSLHHQRGDYDTVQYPLKSKIIKR